MDGLQPPRPVGTENCAHEQLSEENVSAEKFAATNLSEPDATIVATEPEVAEIFATEDPNSRTSVNLPNIPTSVHLPSFNDGQPHRYCRHYTGMPDNVIPQLNEWLREQPANHAVEQLSITSYKAGVVIVAVMVAR